MRLRFTSGTKRRLYFFILTKSDIVFVTIFLFEIYNGTMLSKQLN